MPPKRSGCIDISASRQSELSSSWVSPKSFKISSTSRFRTLNSSARSPPSQNFHLTSRDRHPSPSLALWKSIWSIRTLSRTGLSTRRTKQPQTRMRQMVESLGESLKSSKSQVSSSRLLVQQRAERPPQLRKTPPLAVPSQIQISRALPQNQVTVLRPCKTSSRQ